MPLFRSRISWIAALICVPVAVSAAGLQPATLGAWTTYLSWTQARVAHELTSADKFLALDFGPAAQRERRAVLAGALVTTKMDTVDGGGRGLGVPSALVHHWRGAVLIPGVTLARLMAVLRHEAPPPDDDVVASRVLSGGPDRMTVFLRIKRSSIVSVVYDTEHTITFGPQGRRRATSTSEATKIAEVSDPDTPNERELSAADDHGFLWRLNSYWRYEEMPGGVIAECESVSLSRRAPLVVGYLVHPLIEATARESMERTLGSLRSRFAQSVSAAGY